MKESIELKEKNIQELIMEYPWLLNLNYERIPELKRNGMEVNLSDNKRADLILRDRISGRPVIIEFKSIDFKRENIGQIIEYRARLINEFTTETSILSDVFEQKLSTPILVLVVKNCSQEAQLACNLAGIDIYEYEKSLKEIMIPKNQKSLREFSKSMANDIIPFNADRENEIDRIYEIIKETMQEKFDGNFKKNFKDYEKPDGEYYRTLNHLFINKWIFTEKNISIGIFENIFEEEDSDKVIIEYWSKDRDDLEKFKSKYNELNTELNLTSKVEGYINDDFTINHKISKKEFVENTKKIMELIIENYLKVLESIDFED